MKNTPHRFFTFAVPTHAPHFDNPDYRWTTFVGAFLTPILRDRAVVGFMFLDHAMADYELRLAVTDYKPVEDRLRRHAHALGILIQGNPTDVHTIGKNTFGEVRFMEQNRLADADAAARRATLIFQAMHAACELFIDTLIPHGNYWRTEPNGHQQHNPRGNMFESMVHLYSNMSGADFDVFVVPPPVAGSRVFTRAMNPAVQLAPVNFLQPPAAAPGQNAAGNAVCHL